MIYLEHCFYCLFSKPDFTRYQKDKDLEKCLKQWAVGLNNPLTAMFVSVKSHVCPPLIVVLENKMRILGTEACGPMLTPIFCLHWCQSAYSRKIPATNAAHIMTAWKQKGTRAKIHVPKAHLSRSVLQSVRLPQIYHFPTQSLNFESINELYQ